MKVEGGLTIASGGLNLGSQSFSAASLTLGTSPGHTPSNAPLLTASIANPTFTGAVIELSSDSTAPFSYLTATDARTKNTVVDIQHDGSISTLGGVAVHGLQGLTVDRLASLNGGVALARSVLYTDINYLVILTVYSIYVPLTNAFSHHTLL